MSPAFRPTLPVLILLTAMLDTRAAPPEKTPRLDAHGDRLPDCALARLGTVRYRVGEAFSAAALSPDGKTFALSGSRNITLLDATTGRVLRQLSQESNDTAHLAFAPDGKVLGSKTS